MRQEQDGLLTKIGRTSKGVRCVNVGGLLGIRRAGSLGDLVIKSLQWQVRPGVHGSLVIMRSIVYLDTLKAMENLETS